MECQPMRKCDSREVIRYLHTHFARYGSGLTFAMDRGSELANKAVLDIIFKNQSQPYYGTPHHSTSKPVERSNRLIRDLLRMKRSETGVAPNKWPQLLTSTLSTIRFTRDRSTGAMVR